MSLVYPFAMRRVFVLGSPRSGTTWIASMLSRSRLHRLLFEPEIHETTSICDLELHAGSEVGEDARSDVEKVLRNRLVDLRSYRHGVTRFGYHRMNWVIRMLVVKSIRCNLAVDYLGSQSNSRCVFVLRDPWATIRSQARVEFGHLPELSQLLANPGVADFVGGRGYADRELSFAESLALRWVIENVYAIENSDATARHVLVDYDRLCDRPALWRELLSQLRIRVPSGVLEQRVSEPSATSFPNRAAYRLTEQDEAAVESLLECFHVDEFRASYRSRALGGHS